LAGRIESYQGRIAAAEVAALQISLVPPKQLMAIRHHIDTSVQYASMRQTQTRINHLHRSNFDDN
jgi:hypothetical protein